MGKVPGLWKMAGGGSGSGGGGEADLFVAACLRGVLLPDALQHFD
jgi:hypothetical protein